MIVLDDDDDNDDDDDDNDGMMIAFIHTVFLNFNDIHKLYNMKPTIVAMTPPRRTSNRPNLNTQ